MSTLLTPQPNVKPAAQPAALPQDFLLRYRSWLLHNGLDPQQAHWWKVYPVRTYPVTRDKQTRVRPASAQAEAGNIKLLQGPWNEAFVQELENFPDAAHDDQVDALSGALNALQVVFSVSVASADILHSAALETRFPTAFRGR